MFRLGGGSARHSNNVSASVSFIWASDYLKLCIDIMPYEVDLCKAMLETLRRSSSMYTHVLDCQEVKEVAEVVREFLETHPDDPYIPKIQTKLKSFIKENTMQPPRKKLQRGQSGDCFAESANFQHWTSESADSGNFLCRGDSSPDLVRAPRTAPNLLALPSLTELGVDGQQLGGSSLRQLRGGSPRDVDVRPMGSLEVNREPSSSSMSERLGIGWLPPPELGFKCRLFNVLNDATKSIIGKIVAVVLIMTIAVSTLSFVIESVPRFRHTPDECAKLKAAGLKLTAAACEPIAHSSFFIIEAICIAIFTADYVARLALVHADKVPPVAVATDSKRWQPDEERSSSGIIQTLRYMKEPLNIIDLLAILPFYIDICMPAGGSLGFIRVLRLCRILRPFKMAKHHSGMQMFVEVMTLSGQPLLLLLVLNGIIVVLLGSLMYYAEVGQFSVDEEFLGSFPTGVFVRKDRQYNGWEVTPFQSIPYGFWFVCVTMTTVGYGDIFPSTIIGKSLGVLTFYVGIVFLALPIGILSSNFELVYDRYCAKLEIDQHDTKKKKPPVLGVEYKECTNWYPCIGGMRRNLFLLFHEPRSGRLSYIVQSIMMTTIFVSIVTFVLETMPQFKQTPTACTRAHLSVEDCKPETISSAFYITEVVCVALFSIDWVVRAGLVHAADPSDVSVRASQASGRCPGLALTFRYCLQALNIVDFCSCAPFYLELAMGANDNLAVLRVLRLVRLLRLLKSPKLRICLELLSDVINDAMPALLTLFFVTCLMAVLFSSCICFAENAKYTVEDQFLRDYPTGVYVRPTADGHATEVSPFSSIPYAFWWFFVTSTTVGYGDDYPTTTFGRLVAICTFYLGIVLLALPLSIVGQSFNKFYPSWIHAFQELEEISRTKTLMLGPQVDFVDVDGRSPRPSPRAAEGAEAKGGHVPVAMKDTHTSHAQQTLDAADILRKAAVQGDGLPHLVETPGVDDVLVEDAIEHVKADSDRGGNGVQIIKAQSPELPTVAWGPSEDII